MEVSYRKDLRNNYLVVPKLEDGNDETYCVRMLQANSIIGIIKPDQRTIDNQILYYYDITSKQSIEIINVKTTMNYQQIKKLFINLADTIERAYEYLLNENDLVLEPEYIYIELSSGQIYVCYLPGYNKDLKKQMSTLIEYIMNKVEYQDKEAVLFVYNLYSICREEGFSFNNLLKALREKNEEKHIKLETKKHHCLEAQNRDKQEATKEEENLLYKIPVMMEKIYNDEEQYYYPLQTYIYTGICFLGALLILFLSIVTRIIYTSLGNRIDYGKLVVVLLILLCIVGYLMKNIWDKKNRITRIISKEEYVDPRKEDIDRRAIKEQTSFSKAISPKEKLENQPNPTVLLNVSSQVLGCYLEALDKDIYEDIHINDFPFIIGKQRGNVDYCLDKEVVSRYHVKLTREEDKYYITDLNSTNGTHLNEKPLPCYQRNEIFDGDEVAIAGIKYQYKMYSKTKYEVS